MQLCSYWQKSMSGMMPICRRWLDLVRSETSSPGCLWLFQISTSNLNGSLLKGISLSCTLLCKAHIEASSWVCRLPDRRS